MLPDIASGFPDKPDVARQGFRFRFHIEDGKYPLRSGQRRLDHGQLAGNLRNRLAELPGKVQKGRDIAQGKNALQSQRPAHSGYQYIIEGADMLHQGVDDTGHDLRFGGLLPVFLIQTVKSLFDLPLVTENLYHFLSLRRFLHIPVKVAQSFLLFGKIAVAPLHKCSGKQDHDRKEDHGQ